MATACVRWLRFWPKRSSKIATVNIINDKILKNSCSYSNSLYTNIYTPFPTSYSQLQQSFCTPLIRHASQDVKKKTDQSPNSNEKTDEKKLSLFQKFKAMYRNYWYVLVPVHLITSAAWFVGFYYLAKSGVDVVAIMESIHISEKIVSPLRDSSLGYIALSYALYKIATPLRYTVTLGGTTISIKYLKEWGYIKPVPSKEELKRVYQEQKDNLITSVMEKKQEFIQKKDLLKDKKDAFVDNLEKKIKESTSELQNFEQKSSQVKRKNDSKTDKDIQK